MLLVSIHQSYALQRHVSATPNLKNQLQKCYKLDDVFHFADNDLTTNNDPSGVVSSLALVRLTKQLISLDNKHKLDKNSSDWKFHMSNSIRPLRKLSHITAMAIDKTNLGAKPAGIILDPYIESIKSLSIISRILPDIGTPWLQCLEKFEEKSSYLIKDELEPHQLSGIKWAYDCFNLRHDIHLPTSIERNYNKMELPFRIRPSCLSGVTDLSLKRLQTQVNFQVDHIKTQSNKVVRERRKTAWEGDNGVADFAYSGKSMKRRIWSPLVASVRDTLWRKTEEYYDGCLLNLYPDGGSGMRYHIDPDQGVLWDHETAVVSVGATRRFSFREISDKKSQKKPHNFVVMESDVVEMFGDCQTRFQHTVKTAEDKNEEAARASLVFKRTLSKNKGYAVL